MRFNEMAIEDAAGPNRLLQNVLSSAASVLVDRAAGVILLPVEYFVYLECYGHECLALNG